MGLVNSQYRLEHLLMMFFFCYNKKIAVCYKPLIYFLLKLMIVLYDVNKKGEKI